MAKIRLSPEKWIDAGFDAICAEGPSCLAAEPMARRLGTTKGSFYWHFKDVPAYHAALVRQWHARALYDVMEHLEAGASAENSLRAIGHDILNSPTETALRVWSLNDPLVAKAMAEVDTERLTYIQHLLNQIGLRNPAFGQSLLAVLTGLPQIKIDSDPHAAFDALVDTVVALS